MEPPQTRGIVQIQHGAPTLWSHGAQSTASEVPPVSSAASAGQAAKPDEGTRRLACQRNEARHSPHPREDIHTR